jgi:hypothetical protein
MDRIDQLTSRITSNSRMAKLAGLAEEVALRLTGFARRSYGTAHACGTYCTQQCDCGGCGCAANSRYYHCTTACGYNYDYCYSGCANSLCFSYC